MPSDIADRLKKAKSLLEEANTKKAELAGRRKELMKRLANEFKLTSVDEARKKLKSVEDELHDEEQKLSDLAGELDDLMEEVEGD